MNARLKLNVGHLYGSLLFAALTGWLTNSLLIFGLTAALLIGGSLYVGDIRLHTASAPRVQSRGRR